MHASRRWVGSLLLVVTALSSPAIAGSRMTDFKPEVHGFHFSNTFKNDVVSAFEIRTGGLCGGMVYSALDFFVAEVAVPLQDYRPANQTPLHQWIYQRQVHSLSIANLMRWGALVAGLPERAEMYFDHALDEEFAALKEQIDRGSPAPLGVYGVDGRTHQILGIGYSEGSGRESRVVFVYDPNHPNETIAMRADLKRHCFAYDGKTTAKYPHRYRWTTFFVDRHFKPRQPLELQDPGASKRGMIDELLVQCDTGTADLYGSGEDVSLILHLRDGSSVTYPSINLGGRWLDRYRETARVVFLEPVPQRNVKSVELRVTWSDDVPANHVGWDLKKVHLLRDHAKGRELVGSRDEPFHFDRSTPSLQIDCD